MRKFEYVRYYVCDVCGKISGSEETTRLSEYGEIPECNYPRTWATIYSKDGFICYHVCNDHNIEIDGKTVEQIHKTKVE